MASQLNRCGCVGLTATLHWVDEFTVVECNNCGATWVLLAERVMRLNRALEMSGINTIRFVDEDNAPIIIPGSEPSAAGVTGGEGDDA